MESSGKLTLWSIEVFRAVAEEGAISGAARRLGASPSSVSQQLSNLEAVLGVLLLDRTQRPMGLTPAGLMFRRRALAILDEADLARAELASRGLSDLPRLRLGIIEDFEADLTPCLLAGMAEAMPRTRFVLETGPSHRLLDQLEHRALDLVIAADQGEGRGERHALLADPFVVVCPAGQPPDAPGPRGYIAYSERHIMGRQISAHLARHAHRVAPRLELDSYLAILAMVAEGRGWTILSAMAVSRAQRFQEAIDLRPLPVPALQRDIALFARDGLLGALPAETAETARGLIAEQVIDPLVARWPALSGQMRLL